MRVRDCLNIGDLRRLARRRLPRVLFECIESGAEDEVGIARNCTAFHRHRLLPRHLVDVSARDQKTSLFGRDYASPFGIAPTGIAALFRRGADEMLAQAAVAGRVPYIMSGSGFASIERVAAVAPDNSWYQLYATRDRAIAQDMVRRAKDAGFAALVLTVDQPVSPKLERDKRNGFAIPLKLKLPILLEALTHPAWVAEYLSHGGMPMLETWAAYAPAGASAQEVAVFRRTQTPCVQTWRDVEALRTLWPGPLMVKGIMHPDDARRAAALGVDGVIVSNHGGKALDRAPATIDSLAAVAAAVGGEMTVMLDSGVRRGSDIIVAKCLGAQFVFVGRAGLYGVAAGGTAGVSRAIDILREEIDTTLALIGCPRFAELGPHFLAEPA